MDTVIIVIIIIYQIEEKKRTQPKEELRWRQSAECGEAAPAIVFWSFVSYSQIMALVKMWSQFNVCRKMEAMKIPTIIKMMLITSSSSFLASLLTGLKEGFCRTTCIWLMDCIFLLKSEISNFSAVFEPNS